MVSRTNKFRGGKAAITAAARRRAEALESAAAEETPA